VQVKDELMVIGMTTKRFRPFSGLIAIASAASSPTMDRQAQAFFRSVRRIIQYYANSCPANWYEWM